MNLSAQDEALWAAGLVGNAVLFAALILRQRWRGFPVFSVLIGFYVARTVLLFAMYRYSSAIWYARVYWFAASMDFGLQLGVVWEVARIVMRPTGTWVQDARKQFFLWGGAAGVQFVRCYGSPRKPFYERAYLRTVLCGNADFDSPWARVAQPCSCANRGVGGLGDRGNVR